MSEDVCFKRVRISMMKGWARCPFCGKGNYREALNMKEEKRISGDWGCEHLRSVKQKNIKIREVVIKRRSYEYEFSFSHGCCDYTI